MGVYPPASQAGWPLYDKGARWSPAAGLRPDGRGDHRHRLAPV